MMDIHLLSFSGIFEPPLDGVYLFTIYAITGQVSNGPMYIKKDDDVLCQTYITESDFSGGACTAIAELTVGDSVRVTGDTSDPGVIRSGDSGFAGHIIVEN